MSNFSFSRTVFYPFREPSACNMKKNNCCLQTLSVSKSPNMSFGKVLKTLSKISCIKETKKMMVIGFFSISHNVFYCFKDISLHLNNSMFSKVYFLRVLIPFPKQKLLITSNFSFSQCFLPVWRTFYHFHYN